MVDSQFVEDCLKYHNALRTLHNSPDLVIDIKLNDFAQDWALTLAGKDILEHREENDYGENLYVGYNSDPEWKLNPKDAVKSWYDEISAYKFGEPSPENLPEVGHFTQLVWKASEKLGVGMAISESGKVYVVCNYEPAGNLLEHFPENVKPAKKGTDEAWAAIASTVESLLGTEGLVFGNPSDKSVRPKLPVLPPEEMAIWLNWLTKVADTAMSEWNEWLLAHIDLSLRLHKYVQKAQKCVLAGKGTGELGPCDCDPCEEDETVSAKASKIDDVVVKQEPEEGNEEATDDVPSPSADATEKETGEVTYEDADGAAAENAEDAEVKTTKSSKSKVKIESALSLRTSSLAQNPLPLPEDQCELTQLLWEFRLQANRYRSMYQNWQKMADRVTEEIMKIPPEPPTRIQSRTETTRSHAPSENKSRGGMSAKTQKSLGICPSAGGESKAASLKSGRTAANGVFSFLNDEMEINSDDEDQVDCGTNREKIVYKNYNLFFNLKIDEEDDDDGRNKKSVKSSRSRKSKKSKGSKSCGSGLCNYSQM